MSKRLRGVSRPARVVGLSGLAGVSERPRGCGQRLNSPRTQPLHSGIASVQLIFGGTRKMNSD
jgi:hypothetical protein